MKKFALVFVIVLAGCQSSLRVEPPIRVYPKKMCQKSLNQKYDRILDNQRALDLKYNNILEQYNEKPPVPELETGHTLPPE
jgi:hypothetical protein